VGPDDRIYVGGDQAVCVFEPQGTKQAEIALDDKPRCLAIAGSTGSANGAAEHASPGWLYVGMADHVEVYAVDHPADKPADNPANNPVGGDSSRRVPQQTWDSLGRKALLSSIAVAEDNVFVADAGNKIVLRYDTAGRLLGRIGQRDARRKIPGFMVTSAAFDLAVAPDGLLRVVNPLLRRIEAYTFDGDLESSWGDSATGIAGFFGCCNPAEFAIFSDGRYVTAEKGIPRIKVYDAQGQFVCVVAGPEQMPVTAADLAVDSRGRILALDPTNKSVRVFAHK
jgi:hypothetical protein